MTLLILNHIIAFIVANIARYGGSVLFEDAPYDTTKGNYLQTLYSAMFKALRAVNAESVIHKTRDSLSVIP